MLKKTLSLLLVLSLAPGLSNCAQGQINGVSSTTGTTGTSSPGPLNETITNTKIEIVRYFY